jgi:hypothetical protein
MITLPANAYESRVSPDGTHRVRIAKLDTLWKAGKLPLADFIKIDVEGHEPEVLRGAEAYLAASPLFGADIETTFNTNEACPHSHLSACMALLIDRGLRVADFAVALPDRPPGRGDLLWPGTINALFCRDILRGAKPVSTDAALKCIAMLDAYAAHAQAHAVLNRHRDTLRARIDVDGLAAAIESGKSSQLPGFLQAMPHLGLGIGRTFLKLTRLFN